MRSLAFVVLLGALLVLATGCGAGEVSEADVESKSQQINEATEKLTGEKMPPENDRD